jgi:hypothetical protein
VDGPVVHVQTAKQGYGGLGKSTCCGSDCGQSNCNLKDSLSLRRGRLSEEFHQPIAVTRWKSFIPWSSTTFGVGATRYRFDFNDLR